MKELIGTTYLTVFAFDGTTYENASTGRNIENKELLWEREIAVGCKKAMAIIDQMHVTVKT